MKKKQRVSPEAKFSLEAKLIKIHALAQKVWERSPSPYIDKIVLKIKRLAKGER